MSSLIFARGSLVVFLIVVGGCASSLPPMPAPRTGESPVINPPRSERGNPKFYEVRGRRYYVMDTAQGYREDGVASWYGRDFHGRLTSSGERYDMFALTAAHKTLPLPTWVEVTNRKNGRQVIVKVNDRGPFIGNRIIDLSYAAALELDMVGDGTARVFVRALGAPAALPQEATTASTIEPRVAPSPTPIAPAPAPAPAPAASQGTFVQVGAFSEQANAVRVRSVLQRAGVGNVHVHDPEPTAGGVHRVHIGPFATETELDLVRGKLRALGFADGHLVLERLYE